MNERMDGKLGPNCISGSNENRLIRHKMGRVKQKSAFEHAQSLIRAFALNYNILKYPMILFEESEDPDQTARMHRLIWVFSVCICPKARFRTVWPK